MISRAGLSVPPSAHTPSDEELLREGEEIGSVFKQAVQEAREENRRLGIPNVQVDEQGRLTEELPDGTIRLIETK